MSNAWFHSDLTLEKSRRNDSDYMVTKFPIFDAYEPKDGLLPYSCRLNDSESVCCWNPHWPGRSQTISQKCGVEEVQINDYV